ncbi:MAG: helicase [Gammaproteobacteria bacterium]|nr:helicase [Gammaproteobacteria bacterium]
MSTLTGPEGVTASIGKLSFVYAGERVDADYPEHCLVRRCGDRFKVLTRALGQEERARAVLAAAGLEQSSSTTAGSGAKAGHGCFDFARGWTPVAAAGWPDFMVNGVPALRAAGWKMETERGFAFRTVECDHWSVSLEASSSGLLTVDLRAHIGGAQMSLWPALGQLWDQLWLESSQRESDGREHGGRELRGRELRGGETSASQPPSAQDYPLVLAGGYVVPAPGRRLHRVRQVLAELGVEAERLRAGRVELSRFQAAALVELDAPHLGLRLAQDNELLQLGKRIAAFSGIRELPEPPGLGVTLRPYQRQALGWFAFLADIGSGGCLADDMGLGKTVQTLAYLLVEKLAGRAVRPSLIVAPTSVLGNWVREANRVTPQLRVLLLHGPRRHADFPMMGHYDVCITSYALLPRDEEHLREQPFHLMVLDEAQNIKNPRTRAALVARRIDARRTLALTGTPLENHLGELWALFSVLVPGLLGSEQSFRTAFRRPIERDDNSERSQLLARRLAPFMLRRTKVSVAPELPPRTEILHRISLLPGQAVLYERVREQMERRLTQLLRERSLEDTRVEVLSALLRLRQVCCDPRLIEHEAPSAESAKLDLLLELVTTLLGAGHRILVFSQFTSMLALIAKALREQLGVGYLKLTGETRDRQKLIDEFQNGGTPIFLVSLKAGGTGLNLTAADTVIHYDPWWNPAVQEQASDRAHRIGQTHPVFIHKLLTEGTVEERIHDLQASKRRLADGLFEGRGNTGLEWTAERLAELLAPTPT